jgi:hypothetical protein
MLEQNGVGDSADIIVLSGEPKGIEARKTIKQPTTE